MKTISFHPTILREYDIRGVVDQTLFEKDAYWIGRCFGHIVLKAGGKAVGVCRDGRLSSPLLQKALLQGFCEAGIDVYDLGVGPTPLLYFAEYALPIDGGVMVTGSHNPPSHNGFKMSLQKKPFFGEKIQGLSQLSPQELRKGQGNVCEHQLSFQYITRLLEGLPFGQELRVAWDSGNGATGDILKKLVQNIPGDHILLNTEIDGHFPAHSPDPSNPANLKQLQETVKKHTCDLGIAFDGDGDRLVAVDSHGHIFWGDQLLLVFATDLLQRRPQATIIADVKASQGIFDAIDHMGGKGLMWKTGHSHIKTKMASSDALLAGEMSGHFFFKENYYGFDDGLYAAIRLLHYLSHSPQSLADFYKRLPQAYATPEIRIPCPADRKFDVPSSIKGNIQAEGYPFVDIDGIRVQLKDGWWVLRASHTEDALVVRCEASTQKGLETLKKHLAHKLERQHISCEDLLKC